MSPLTPNEQLDTDIKAMAVAVKTKGNYVCAECGETFTLGKGICLHLRANKDGSIDKLCRDCDVPA